MCRWTGARPNAWRTVFAGTRACMAWRRWCTPRRLRAAPWSAVCCAAGDGVIMWMRPCSKWTLAIGMGNTGRPSGPRPWRPGAAIFCTIGLAVGSRWPRCSSGWQPGPPACRRQRRHAHHGCWSAMRAGSWRGSGCSPDRITPLMQRSGRRRPRMANVSALPFGPCLNSVRLNPPASNRLWPIGARSHAGCARASAMNRLRPAESRGFARSPHGAPVPACARIACP